jgi:hypothetical protein
MTCRLLYRGSSPFTHCATSAVRIFAGSFIFLSMKGTLYICNNLFVSNYVETAVSHGVQMLELFLQEREVILRNPCC